MAQDTRIKRWTLLQEQGWYCRYCYGPVTWGSGPRQANVEHITPRALGGADEHWNTVIACRTCNIRKHARTPVGWVRHLNKIGQPIPTGLLSMIVEQDQFYGLPLRNPYHAIRRQGGEPKQPPFTAYVDLLRQRAA